MCGGNFGKWSGGSVIRDIGNLSADSHQAERRESRSAVGARQKEGVGRKVPSHLADLRMFSVLQLAMLTTPTAQSFTLVQALRLPLLHISRRCPSPVLVLEDTKTTAAATATEELRGVVEPTSSAGTVEKDAGVPYVVFPKQFSLAIVMAILMASTEAPTVRAWLSYGDAAQQAPPAIAKLGSSPIRTTGAKASTCEAVAVGREDVCLEPKEPISAFENMQLGRAIVTLGVARLDTDNDDLRNLIELAAKMIGMARGNQFGDIEKTIEALDAAALDRATVSVEGKKELKSSLSALEGHARKREASPAAQSLVKLTTDLSRLVDHQF